MNDLIKQIFNSIKLNDVTIAIHTFSGIIFFNKEDIVVEKEDVGIIRLTFVKNNFLPTTDVPIVLQYETEKYMLKYHFFITGKGHYYECIN